VEPGRSDAYFEAHACLLQLKRFDEALECLDKMVELEPNSADSVEYYRRNITRQRLVFQDMLAEQVENIAPMLDLIRNKDDEEVKHSIGNLTFDPIFLAKVLWSAKLSPEALLQLRVIGLPDENKDVRFSAVAVLGFKKYREALNDILFMLAKDPSPRVRCAAAASLNMIGDPEALPWLKKIAEIDPVDVVREAASDALRKLELRTKIFQDLP
jgi:tetratricopeptide (TPR) repeat protein